MTQDKMDNLDQTTAPETGETVRAEQDTTPEPELDPVEQLTAERDDLKDRLLRLAAETDNYKKRSEREKSEFLKRANERLLKDLLPVMDNLERAMEHAVEEGGSEAAIVKGLELTAQEMWKVLERHGVERIESLGEPFDPEFHEAMMQQEDPDVDENTVIGVLQKGYLSHGRLLRPAMVIVSKRPAGQEDEPDDPDTVKITIN